MSTEMSQKSPIIFECSNCDYTTCNKKDYNKHLKTIKHQTLTKSTIVNKKSPKIPNSFICVCGRYYKDRSGLWRHKKICNVEEKNILELSTKDNDETVSETCINDKELVVMLIKQNSELIKDNSEYKNLMMKFLENGTHNTTNSHNKTFNLQFFLNETCKDAMNIMDFVDSIKLQLNDLETVGKIGYVEGISNIIVKNLKALDVSERPIHCTDKKRETLYIKDENKWEKEDEEKKKLRKAIKKVASKNQRLLPKFKEAHPDCGKSVSKFSDQYNKIIIESMGGSGDNDNEKEDKIIKNIVKNVTIDKELN